MKRDPHLEQVKDSWFKLKKAWKNTKESVSETDSLLGRNMYKTKKKKNMATTNDLRKLLS